MDDFDEELDAGCVATGDISNTGNFEIAVGTFSGKLLIYRPSAGEYRVSSPRVRP